MVIKMMRDCVAKFSRTGERSRGTDTIQLPLHLKEEQGLMIRRLTFSGKYSQNIIIFELPLS